MDRIEDEASLELMKVPRKTNSPSRDLVSRDLVEPSELQAFEQAFENNWPAIYRLLARMVGDPSEAEDLALEAFYRLYRRGNQVDPDFNTTGWLRRVAINLGLHSIRSFRRRLAHELRAGRLNAEDPRGGSPLQILAEREEHNLARAALGRLTPRQSRLLLMRHSGASYKEIASALHVSPTSIGPLLLRAERDFGRQFGALAQEDS